MSDFHQDSDPTGPIPVPPARLQGEYPTPSPAQHGYGAAYPTLHQAPRYELPPRPTPSTPRKGTFDGFTGALLFGATVGGIAGLACGAFTALVMTTASGNYNALQIFVGAFAAFAFVAMMVGFLAFCVRGGLSIGRSIGGVVGNRIVDSQMPNRPYTPRPLVGNDYTFVDAPPEGDAPLH